jgi:hypothetical protein
MVGEKSTTELLEANSWLINCLESKRWLGLNLVSHYHMVIQKNLPTNNRSQESKSRTQKNMKPHKMCKWKTMKTQKKLLSKKTQYLKISNHQKWFEITQGRIISQTRKNSNMFTLELVHS